MKLRIMFLAGTLRKGGAEKQLFYSVKTCIELGHQVTVCTLDHSGYWEEKIRDLGVTVLSITSKNRLVRLIKFCWFVHAMKATHIIAQHFYASPYVGIAGVLLRKKAYAAIRNDGFQEMNSLPRWARHIAVSWTTALIANSNTAINNLKEMGVCSELIYIQNVIDISAIHIDANSKEREVGFSFVGRLVEQKRADLFIDFVTALKEGGLVFPIRIVGDGPLRAQMEALAERSAVSVDFLGERDDVQLLLSQSRFLVLTSDFEGFPNVILEAMAASCIVIARPVGGVLELVSHNKTGFICHNTEEMVAVVRRLSNDKMLQEKIIRNAWAVVQKHSHQSHKDRYSQFLAGASD